MNDKNWYALHVRTGFEQNARDMLLERIEQHSMNDHFGEVLLPTEKRVEIKRGKKIEAEGRMFPSYLFVEMEMKPECWHLVRNTKWINGFIGGSYESPRPLREEEITSIRERIETGINRPAFRAKFIAGEQVHIKNGPFDGFTGVVENVNSERERLRISVMVFGRSTPVELDFDQVEKL